MQVFCAYAGFILALIRRRVVVSGLAVVAGLGWPTALLLSLPAMAAVIPDSGIVSTQSGQVRGIVNGSVAEFLGIPYAAPPTGPLRWKPPQAPAPWSDVRDASQPGSACPQLPSPFGPASENEDCLYLNIYAPANANGGLPVIVWIHGGAFISGQGSDYDGSALVQSGNVIVVSINYRLGIFGFLAHPALDSEVPDHSSGNYGLLDQQFALRWVQSNIGSFGGDPGNVTVAGESAGGFSVLTHMASPTAAGLFRRAIVESGGSRLAWASAYTARTQGRKIAKSLGCITAVAQCLRAQSVAQLLAVQGLPESLQTLLQWGPNTSGAILRKQWLSAAFRGVFNRVPVLMGSNHDEGRLFVGLSYTEPGFQITAANYADTIKSLYGAAAVPLVLAAYPLDAYPSPDLAVATLFGDSASCQSYLIEQMLAPRVDAYVYEFDDENAPMVLLPDFGFPYGATHTSELPYLFPEIESHLYDLGQATLDANQLQLAATMRAMWAQFASSGIPNGDGLPQWASYANGTAEFLSLVTPAPLMSSGFASEHQCAFWTPLLGVSGVLLPWF
jgi:para-nitrobenzyl esterase